MGSLVQSERVSSGGAGRHRGFLRGRAASAGLPPLPDLHQLHHLGVHVPSQDLVPEELRGGREPVRPRLFLQPVGFLLYLQDGDVGAGLPEECSQFCLN